MRFRDVALPALAGLYLLLSGRASAEDPQVSIPLNQSEAVQVANVAGKPALPTAAITGATGQTMSAAAPAGDQFVNWVGKKFQRGPAAGKMIALTFDDGPNPRTTPRVVSILEEAGITATFFWLGHLVEKYPDLTKQVAAKGHELGSHSWSHKNLRALSFDAARQEVISAQDIMQQVTGVRPRLFRPPYGNINANVEKITREDGLVMVMWAVDSNDWKPGMTPDRLQARIKEQTHPGAVILFHDIHERTIQALPAMIADWKAQGYQFVTVSKLIEEANKNPQAMSGSAGSAEEMGMSAPAQPLVIPLSETN